MRVLITGGLGFVGRHFVRHFAKTNSVSVVDDYSAGTRYWPWMRGGNINFTKADVRKWMPYNRPSEFDLIVHCAAVVGGRMTIDYQPLKVAADLAIDSDFFNWLASDISAPKVIYFSSSAVYPIELQTASKNIALGESLVSFDSNRIGMPDMTYGFAKLAGEYLAKQAVEKYGIDVRIYRPFSGYGEDQSDDYPFPSIVKRVFKGEDPVVVWGSGSQQRDFIHIDDIVDAVVATMDKPELIGKPLNLGTGKACTPKLLAFTTASICNRAINVEADRTKPEGVFARVADTYNLDRYYKPKISLYEGIQRMVRGLQGAKNVSTAAY